MQRWQDSLMHINGSPLGKNVFTATDLFLNPEVWMFFTFHNDVFNLVSVQFTNNSYYIPKRLPWYIASLLALATHSAAEEILKTLAIISTENKTDAGVHSAACSTQ